MTASGRRRQAIGRRAARAMAAVLVVAGAAGCGVGRGADRVVGGAPPTPDGWHHLTMCRDDGPVTVDVPRPMEFDGSRPPANLTDPAVVTYAWGYTPDQIIRYDAYVVTDVGHYGSTDRGIARRVVRILNGAPDQMRIKAMEDRGDHAAGVYHERYDERDYRFRFLSFDGTIVAVGVGVHDGTPRELVDEASEQLDQMWDSIEAAGLDGAPTGTCDGPRDEPN